MSLAFHFGGSYTPPIGVVAFHFGADAWPWIYFEEVLVQSIYFGDTPVQQVYFGSVMI